MHCKKEKERKKGLKSAPEPDSASSQNKRFRTLKETAPFECKLSSWVCNWHNFNKLPFSTSLSTKTELFYKANSSYDRLFAPAFNKCIYSNHIRRDKQYICRHTNFKYRGLKSSEYKVAEPIFETLYQCTRVHYIRSYTITRIRFCVVVRTSTHSTQTHTYFERSCTRQVQRRTMRPSWALPRAGMRYECINASLLTATRYSDNFSALSRSAPTIHPACFKHISLMKISHL